MRTFNEWLTKTASGLEDFTTTKSLDYQEQDEAIVLNQLEQLVDRVAGVLQYANEDKRPKYIEKLISDIRSRV